jgi:hypothetical protein
VRGGIRYARGKKLRRPFVKADGARSTDNAPPRHASRPYSSRLRSLTLRGGKITPAAAKLLLRGLAVACPKLEQLRVLPEALCGLSDEDMPLLVELSELKVGLCDDGLIGGGGRTKSVCLKYISAEIITDLTPDT